MRALLIAACALLALPVLGVLLVWVNSDAAALGTLAHLADTVLAGYAAQSLLLALGVAVGVALLGVGTAAAVALFRFPGRGFFEWALLLPMAMPAYVLAYAYTDALQASGPLQSALRDSFGWRGALWPDIRSLGGAVLLFVLCLYPYVYLLTRAALGERAVQLMEAARLLGARRKRRLFTVALPLARPAVAAGVALALMETLADYGVGSYFGLSTFTTGIYRAWLSMNDAAAAAQLASMLLALVALLLWLERRSQSRLRFATSRAGAQHGDEAQPQALHGKAALVAFGFCALPVVLGFVLPVGWLVAMLWREVGGAIGGAIDGTIGGTIGAAADGAVDSAAGAGLPLARFAEWAWASFRLAAVAAVAAVLLALALGFAQRRRDNWRDRALALAARVIALGYAVPGAVIAVGILLPLGYVQQRWPDAGAAALFTGTVVGVLYAYLVRFSAVALQSIEAGYARIGPAVDETARLLGAGRKRLFVQLHLPLLKRSAFAALLLVFVDVMKELPATLVLRPFGSDTLAVVAYNLARDERLAEAALPSLAIVLVGLIPVLLLSRAMRR